MTEGEQGQISEPTKAPAIEANVTLLTPRELPASPERSGIRYFEGSVSLVKALVWD